MTRVHFLVFNAAILALVLSGQSESADFQFKCDTPDEWLARPTSIYPGELWPNGTVTYELHSSLTSNDTTEIQKAFWDIQNKTCIRFVPRADDEPSYVSIEHDDNTCGVAHVCRTGGYQFARFGGGCVFANVMIHELGHTLCLGHEQTRVDRDDFVHFDPCSEEETPGKDDFETRGHFYDYTSQMHYQCGWCPGGWPKMEGVQKCGMDVQEGMSVLDADKINDFYDCQGCLSHRWKRIENLTAVDKENLVVIGNDRNGTDFYLCRAYFGGEITPGKYNLEFNTCSVTLNGSVFVDSRNAQVFTASIAALENYDLFPPSETENLVPMGRTANGTTIYGAVAIDLADFTVFGVGKVYANDFSQAYFYVDGKEFVTSQYGIIGCRM